MPAPRRPLAPALNAPALIAAAIFAARPASAAKHHFEPTDLDLQDPGLVELDLQLGFARADGPWRAVLPDAELNLGLSDRVEIDVDFALGVEGPERGNFLSECEDIALDVARREAEAVVGVRARRGERGLDHVEAVHGLRRAAGLAVAREVARGLDEGLLLFGQGEVVGHGATIHRPARGHRPPARTDPCCFHRRIGTSQ